MSPGQNSKGFLGCRRETGKGACNRFGLLSWALCKASRSVGRETYLKLPGSLGMFRTNEVGLGLKERR